MFDILSSYSRNYQGTTWLSIFKSLKGDIRFMEEPKKAKFSRFFRFTAAALAVSIVALGVMAFVPKALASQVYSLQGQTGHDQKFDNGIIRVFGRGLNRFVGYSADQGYQGKMSEQANVQINIPVKQDDKRIQDAEKDQTDKHHHHQETCAAPGV